MQLTPVNISYLIKLKKDYEDPNNNNQALSD